LQVLSVNVFEKVTFNQLFTEYTTTQGELSRYNQLTFNDF